jgi:hypothetical protein
VAKVPVGRIDVVRPALLGASPAGEPLTGVHAPLVVGAQCVVRSVVATLLPGTACSLALASVLCATRLALQLRTAGLGTHPHGHD